MVDRARFELAASSMPRRRSSELIYRPTVGPLMPFRYKSFTSGGLDPQQMESLRCPSGTSRAYSSVRQPQQRLSSGRPMASSRPSMLR